MEDGYVHLMGVYNEEEAENILEILESEGIKALTEKTNNQNSYDMKIKDIYWVDIYVPKHSRKEAMAILEIEMTRGEF